MVRIASGGSGGSAGSLPASYKRTSLAVGYDAGSSQYDPPRTQRALSLHGQR